MEKEKIKQTILKAIKKDPYKKEILKVSLFGSYLYGVPKKDSDVDILIEFRPTAVIGFFGLSQIKRNLEKSIGREVDLLTPEALSKYFRQEVLASAETIYEQK